MKILILTQYFPPEVGAPQNRLFELAVRLKRRGDDVTILTAMPNYPQMKVYEGYGGKFYRFEMMEGLRVHRSWIYASTSKRIIPRLMNYFSFVFSSFWVGLFKVKKHDFLICESPPLFIGITAFWLKLFKGSKLIFNVSDLWPESAEKLGIVKNKFLLKISSWLEEFMYKRSVMVSGQTQGIVANIAARFPKKRTYWLPNGVDLGYYMYDQEYPKEWMKENKFDASDRIFLYAGIIGHAQGLEVILNAAARLKQLDKIKFLIIGSGPEKEKLLKLQAELQLSNVTFLDTVPKTRMPEIIACSTAAIIPLRKLDLFKGAIPSKIFENLAMKKPILLGVEGEAKTLFIDEGKGGLFFEPENDADLAEKITTLYNDQEAAVTCGENGYRFVKQYFTRDLIAEKFRNELETIRSGKI